MVTLAEAVDAAAQLIGLTVIVAAFAAAAAFAYRWYVRERLPDGLAVLVGLSVVAVSIGTTGWLNEVIEGGDALISATAALRNIGVFVVCAGGAVAGARVGNHLARTVATATSDGVIDAEVSTLVEAVGRVISLDLPEEIDDVVGYDPVSPGTKEALEGKTFLFPRRLTVAELRARLIARLRTDYAVGHVDLELAADGSVEYLALGSRAAGIGPTLPPETAAVAIRADPAYAASAGDLVQVWEQHPSRRILTAELRGTADDVVTLAIDAADTPKLDQETRYRLVTLPVDDRPDREFASLLRAADETMATIEVGADSALVGRPVRDVGVTVAAITDDGTTTLPTGDRAIAAGEVLYAIGTPDALRRLEEAAATADAGGEIPVPGQVGSTAASDAGDRRPDPEEREAGAEVAPSGANVPQPSGDGREPSDSGDSEDTNGDDAESIEDGPAVEPVREGYTPVFKPEGERDPLVDAVPGESEGEATEGERGEDDGGERGEDDGGERSEHEGGEDALTGDRAGDAGSGADGTDDDVAGADEPGGDTASDGSDEGGPTDDGRE